jgi:predicted phosphodiesterase
MKLLIISDIHANWTALRAVLDAEPDVDQILCLGDLVDYGPQPIECVEWAIRNRTAGCFIQGNHDWGVATNGDPRPSPPYRHLTAITQRFCMDVLEEGCRSFLGSLEPLRTLMAAGAKCVACHATPSDPLFRYLRFSNHDLEAEIELAGAPDFLFLGHTHWPLTVRSGKTLVVNPGSVGQPKDGDPRAAYAVWRDGEVALRRAAYDVERTIGAYARVPLDAGTASILAEVLRTGGNLPV